MTFATISDDAPPTPPRSCPRRARFLARSNQAWFQLGFLLQGEPQPHNANPNVPTVVLLLVIRDERCDPDELACADALMIQHFDNLQRQVD